MSYQPALLDNKKMGNNSYEVAEKIHRQVNFNIEYRSDMEQYGEVEVWTEAGKYGDCEDYVLAKRKKLLQVGWPIDKLSLCTCHLNGDGHAVLYVDTDKGGYILDNRYEWPMQPTSLPYKWDKIMRGGEWYELHGWQ